MPRSLFSGTNPQGEPGDAVHQSGDDPALARQALATADVFSQPVNRFDQPVSAERAAGFRSPSRSPRAIPAVANVS